MWGWALQPSGFRVVIMFCQQYGADILAIILHDNTIHTMNTRTCHACILLHQAYPCHLIPAHTVVCIAVCIVVCIAVCITVCIMVCIAVCIAVCIMVGIAACVRCGSVWWQDWQPFN